MSEGGRKWARGKQALAWLRGKADKEMKAVGREGAEWTVCRVTQQHPGRDRVDQRGFSCSHCSFVSERWLKNATPLWLNWSSTRVSTAVSLLADTWWGKQVCVCVGARLLFHSAHCLNRKILNNLVESLSCAIMFLLTYSPFLHYKHPLNAMLQHWYLHVQTYGS